MFVLAANHSCFFQWTAHGRRGRPGVAAAAPAEEVPPQESVHAHPHWLEADLVKERVWTTRNVELGNAQVLTLWQCYSINPFEFQWMAHGQHGQHGAAAAALVVQDRQPEFVLVHLPRPGAHLARERTQITKPAKSENV